LVYTFGNDFHLTSRDISGLLFLGIFQLGFGYLFFAKGAKFISSVEIAIYTLLEPICNPLWTFLGTGEIPGFWPLVGGGLVLSAMVINSVFKKNENE
jgi:drug/metabolite transporter (DMT)-like permease